MRISDWSSDVCSSDLGPRDRSIAQDLVLGDVPIFGNIGEVGVADDDQQIKIGLIAVLRIIDPVAANITAEQDDLLDLAVLLPRLRRARGRNGKFVHQNPRRARQFSLDRKSTRLNSSK